MIAGGIAGVVALLAIICIILLLRRRTKRRNAQQAERPNSNSENAVLYPPWQPEHSPFELHEDERPHEMGEEGIKEMHGQSIQEMEQRAPPVEMSASPRL